MSTSEDVIRWIAREGLLPWHELARIIRAFPQSKPRMSLYHWLGVDAEDEATTVPKPNQQ
jgi:hypothetical protein